MATIGSMWTGYPYIDVGDYSICVLQANSLQPIYLGKFISPVGVPKDKKLLAISGGSGFVCGLLYGSQFPICWGDIELPQSLENISFTSLNCGRSHCCAIRSDDSKINCWGIFIYKSPDQPFVSVSLGIDFSCGLTQDGNITCWGHLSDAIPQPDRGTGTFVSLFAGGYSICGIESSTRDILCWGEDASYTYAPSVFQFSSVTGGRYHMCGIRADNHQVVCWGQNNVYQLRAPKNVSFTAISAGDFYTCGFTRDGRLRVLCWGGYKEEYWEVNITGIHVSQAICSSRCRKDQYQTSKYGCPSLTDRVCLDCSVCTGDDIELVPCGINTDRVCGKPSLASHQGDIKNLRKLFLVLLYLIITLSFGLILMATFSYFTYMKKRKLETLANIVSFSRSDILYFSSAELREATNNYSDEMVLSKSASGNVYKGLLQNGQEVAIKQAKLFNRYLKLINSVYASQ
ncbi:hypothetical protein SELMODRAFT_412300 [Selaginella moellendorffii]|uniref:non-specific serine/threonine protein kinase n=1 Tax=Selaginella moellendorffii TaxID=88036 RepID=D8RKP8_SELML|nr:hypothetical protein SELMODRAFT_412300 [Selaginella moellendorffii]